MNYVAALIAAFIAAIVALINIQQYFLACERFKLDLFEKRFAIFKSVEIFLNEVINLSIPISTECLQKFDIATQTAVFLFEDDIVTFLKEIRLGANKVITLRAMHKEHQPGSKERHELVEKEIEVMQSFMDAQHNLKERFSPYLKFKNWKYKFLSGNSN